eukprot:TRINITY_DN2781_c0_g2_i1.p1 TRINITY_DN2781_c0_g2~~TRINITY_DN2781_c0_g2_i1.p1  ORF type:complete len:427 (-),score=74.69 TRINITY_DN2781_c0_g2_i1:188-1426(-)
MQASWGLLSASGGGSCSGGGGGTSSRAPSVPPCRWAPSGPSFNAAAHAATASAASGLRSGSIQRIRSDSHGPNLGAMQRAPSNVAPNRAPTRGRSASPLPSPLGGSVYGQAVYNPNGSCAATPAAIKSREESPMPRSSTTVELGWNEVIKPEQLVFGSQLGAGGSAQVYRGSWNGQEVAIKKISGVAHLEEMTKEINAMRRLRHPRLVRFMGACIQPPLLLVVTELVSGGSLHDRIFGQMRTNFSPMQRHTIALQMVEGIGFLHSNRVVHRDLKSMNILLDGNFHAKICDFGLAQQMEATHIVRRLEGEGGSPRYMAPECYDAMHGKLTEKVDIWAMGCILIEMFAGVLPYSDCTSMAQLSARILVERRSPDVPPCVPGPIADLIRRAVVFDPSRRLTIAEALGELSRLRPG